MANEVAQWIVLVVLSVLMLGVLRQISLLLPAPTRAEEAGPPTGRMAPKRLLDQLGGSDGNSAFERGALVAFVTENCPACQTLIADAAEGRQKLDGRPLVLVAHKPSKQFHVALKETGIRLIVDHGDLWDDCRVTATPLVVRIDESGRTTMKEVTHRVEEIAQAEPES